MRIARTALAESVVQPPGHRAVNIGHRRIVEIAADDAPRTRVGDDIGNAIDLCGTQDAVLAQAAHDAADLDFACRVGDEIAVGDIFVVGRLDRRRTQVVVEHAHRIVTDQQVGPDRRIGGQDDARAQDTVFAQDEKRCPIQRIGSLRAAEGRAFVFLVQQGEIVGFLGQAGIELLHADDIGIVFADQAHDVIDIAGSAFAEETAHVIGHDLESPAVVALLAVAAAEFGLIEERNLEEADDDQRQYRSGAEQPPADDPVERQDDRSDVDRRGGKPQQGKEPDPGGVHIRDEIGDGHRGPDNDGQERHHQVEQPHEQAAVRFLPAPAAVIVLIEFAGHRLRSGLCRAASTSGAAGNPKAYRPRGRNAPHCLRRASRGKVR